MRTPNPLRLALLALHLLLLTGCASALASPAAPTTLIVVRHAERASETDEDSPLSPAGEVRARALADALQGAGVAAVYATQFQRTQQTARPTAERAGVQVRVEHTGRGDQAERSAAELVRGILDRHAGETVLLVGHSNTVPMIVRALGAGDVGPIASTTFDNLFVVTVRPDGAARLIRARYGEKSR